MKKNLLLFSILSLILGTLIYLLFRVSSLKVFSWLNFAGIDLKNFELRKITIQFIPNIPEWIIFSLPDGLWIFSYVTLMLYIWKNRISIESVFWITVIPIIAIFSEIFQSFRLIPGTFDFIDLIFYILGLTIPFIIINKKKQLKIY